MSNIYERLAKIVATTPDVLPKVLILNPKNLDLCWTDYRAKSEDIDGASDYHNLRIETRSYRSNVSAKGSAEWPASSKVSAVYNLSYRMSGMPRSHMSLDTRHQAKKGYGTAAYSLLAQEVNAYKGSAGISSHDANRTPMAFEWWHKAVARGFAQERKNIQEEVEFDWGMSKEGTDISTPEKALHSFRETLALEARDFTETPEKMLLLNLGLRNYRDAKIDDVKFIRVENVTSSRNFIHLKAIISGLSYQYLTYESVEKSGLVVRNEHTGYKNPDKKLMKAVLSKLDPSYGFGKLLMNEFKIKTSDLALTTSEDEDGAKFFPSLHDL